MAAVTAGRPSKRRSRRIASACAFLSNISLDGNIVRNHPVNGFQTEKNMVKRSHENVTGNVDSLSQRVLHSISEPGTSEGDEANISARNVNIKVMLRQRSDTDAFSERKQQERSVVIRRSVSMSESTDSSSTSGSIRSKHRISCLTGSSFHHKRRATDKR